MIFESPLGELTLVGDDQGLRGLYFPGHWTNPDREGWGTRVEGGFDEAQRQLSEYFAGSRQTFDLPLRPQGTERARELWRLLEAIPYGHTTTYRELAAQMGSSPRGVGTMVGRNPLSIFIPCHRVVGSSGKLTGYAGGFERKQRLLELEGVLLG